MTEWTEELIRQFVTENGYLPALVSFDEIKFDQVRHQMVTDKLESDVIYDTDLHQMIIFWSDRDKYHVVHYVSKNTALLLNESNQVIGLMIELYNNLETI